ncbi:MAG: 6-bladed beta-propeller, partial [Bacteroidetes bacterium]|nr:6-bladed beta-propeller [Bacteroidota bacterium]
MKAFTLLFVIILICSCSVTKNNNKDQVFEIIDFENSLNNSNAIKTYISEIADEIEYIELETKRNNIIGKIGDIKIHGDTLVILDSTTKELLLFNKKGQFLNKIGSIGKGPGEYVQITTWDIDQQNKSILLYDNKLQKFIKFSMNGILLEERKTDFRPMSIRFSNNSDLFLF